MSCGDSPSPKKGDLMTHLLGLEHEDGDNKTYYNINDDFA
jgi:hypothetical protein